MRPYRDRLRVVAAVLLVAAGVLLVVGTSLERAQATSETSAAGAAQGAPGEAGEHNRAAAQPTVTPTPTTKPAGGSGGTKKAATPAQSTHNEVARARRGGG
jgi:hypothetical protein